MMEHSYLRRRWTSRIMLFLCSAAAGIAILLLVLILIFRPTGLLGTRET